MCWFGRPEKRPPHVLAAANAMLDLLREDGQEANLIRLQRLLILSHRISLSTGGGPIFAQDVIVLMDTPAIAEIHDAFRRWGPLPITEHARRPDIPFAFPADEDPKRLDVMREVVRACRAFSGYQLGTLLRRDNANARDGETVTLRDLSMPLRRTAA